MDQQHLFGGGWTEEKLTCLERYLAAYMTALKKQRFEKWYIDAFAGTGYRSDSSENASEQLTIALEEEAPQVEAFQDGSVIKALQVKPAFDRYVLIEKNAKRSRALWGLRGHFPRLEDRIRVVGEDCNQYLQSLMAENWRDRRAVVFMDPYGMQVEWATLEALGRSGAVDLWLLFPHAYGVNRMLRRDGELPPSWRARLDAVFGTDEWYDVFYKRVNEEELFGPAPDRIQKEANLELISEYFLNRLATVFAGVARNPAVFRNHQGVPLYMLCFACANPKGAELAMRMAQQILGKTSHGH